MSLDGFSMGNLGLVTDMTSAQMASQVEHLLLKESEIKIKDVEESAEEQGVKRKEQNSEENQSKNKRKKKKNDLPGLDDLDESFFGSDETSGYVTEKDFENKDPKEFSVRINPETEVVELYSVKEGKVLETISAKDLMNLISKLDNASGILVNRKI